MQQRGCGSPVTHGARAAGAPPQAVTQPELAHGCEIWGVLNVTPDSFSDGGAYFSPDTALRHARAMRAAGAAVIDVGGESSRPAGKTYGTPARVSEAEELQRVVPVVEALCAEGFLVSIDTVKPRVAEQACRLGAGIINDVSCGGSDALLQVAADAGAQLVLMHNRGRGECTGANVRYHDVVGEVHDALLRAAERALALGVARERIWLDPGIGFAKTAEQSMTVLANLGPLLSTGQRVLVGPSRKSFIAQLAPGAEGSPPGPGERGGGTAAAVALAVMQGAHALRVHDVAMMRQAAMVAAWAREARR